MSSDTVLGTVVICTALDIEYIAVREHLEGPFKEREERGTFYQIGTFPTDRGRWTVALAQTGAGNTQAGLQLDRAVAVFHPTLVLFVGVAGGRKDVALGDVVIADAIYDYESGKDTATDYLPRIKTAAPSHRLLSRAGQLARDDAWQHRILPTTTENSPKAVVKPIAAGGKVIADENSPTAVSQPKLRRRRGRGDGRPRVPARRLRQRHRASPGRARHLRPALRQNRNRRPAVAAHSVPTRRSIRVRTPRSLDNSR